MEILGSIGIGTVWGWLLAQLCAQSRLSFKAIAAMVAATVAATGVVYGLSGTSAVLAHAGAIALGSVARIAWLRVIEKSYVNTIH